MKSFFAALSLILSTNATIRASYLNHIRSNVAFSILPRLSYNSLSFQNFGFKNKIKLDHFQPVLFKNCYFASSVDLNSHAPLYLENCHNITGTILSSSKIIYVSNSSFNQNFVGFDIQDCDNCSFINSNFSTNSSKRVITLKNSQSQLISCNFNNCLNGAIVSIDSNLSVINSVFQNINSNKGSAIYFIGEKLFVDNCLFSQCQSAEKGGAIYFLANESTFQKSRFIQNYSPKGKSIYYYKGSKPILNDCFFTYKLEKEIVEEQLESKRDISILRHLAIKPAIYIPPTRSPFPTITQSPTASASPSPSFSPTASRSPSPSRSPSRSPTPSQSPSPSPSPVATQTPFATPSFIERELVGKKKYYITFVSVICAAIVVVVIIIVVVVLVKKKRNRVYPKTDSDEADPQGVSVVVNRIYDENTKTIENEP